MIRSSTAVGLARHRGYILIKLLFLISVVATVSAVAIPATRDAIDELRTAMAARSLSARLMYARIDAVKRSASVALRFEPVRRPIPTASASGPRACSR